MTSRERKYLIGKKIDKKLHQAYKHANETVKGVGDAFKSPANGFKQVAEAMAIQMVKVKQEAKDITVNLGFNFSND